MRYLLCGTLVAFLTLAPAPADKPIAPVPLPAGVADPEGKIGYFAGAKGVIEAVNLEKGELLWDTKEQARPLVAFDNFLAVQVKVADKPDRVRIVVLDVKQKGKKVLESDPVVFPEWVSVVITYGQTFSSEASVHKGQLLLKWRANAFYAGGAPPPPEVIEAARKEASGVARVDLQSGKVTMAALDKTPAKPEELPVELKKVASQQYWTGSDWNTTPFVIGNTVTALAVQNLGGAAEMSLKRWDRTTGKPLDSATMLKGKELWPQVSADGKYVFVHQGLVKEQLPPGDYAWWVFSLETGKQVAKLPYEGSLVDATVLGERLYHLVGGPRKPGFGGGERVQPRHVKAVDLKSGKLVWERPVEGVRFLPPLP